MTVLSIDFPASKKGMKAEKIPAKVKQEQAGKIADDLHAANVKVE